MQTKFNFSLLKENCLASEPELPSTCNKNSCFYIILTIPLFGTTRQQCHWQRKLFVLVNSHDNYMQDGLLLVQIARYYQLQQFLFWCAHILHVALWLFYQSYWPIRRNGTCRTFWCLTAWRISISQSTSLRYESNEFVMSLGFQNSFMWWLKISNQF